jgi:hypothetical protein
MTPDEKQALNSAVLRNTGGDPLWMGYWLNRFEESEGVDPSELAKQLGIDGHRFALLCLCRTPRQEHFQEDIDVVCNRTGANSEMLMRIIRQEQTLTKWRNSKPMKLEGWLMAASDHEGAAEDQRNEGVGNDEV